MSNDSTIRLWCLILGDDFKDNGFSVNVAESKNVLELKKIIKEKMEPRFNDYSIRDWHIYQVLFPTGDNAALEELLKGFRKSETSFLGQLQKLRDVFKNPVEGHLHVIIKPPPSECRSLYL